MKLPDPFDRYVVELETTSQVLGSIPTDLKQREGWMQAKNLEPKREEIEEVIPLEEKEEQEEKRGLSVFRRDEKGLFLPFFVFKQAFRSYARYLRLWSIKSKKGLLTYLHGTFYIEPARIYLDGKKEADGTLDMAGTISVPTGRRSIQSRFEYVDPPLKLKFEMLFLRQHTPSGEKALVALDDLKECFAVGQIAGFGTRRTEHYGKFKVLKIEKVEA